MMNDEMNMYDEFEDWLKQSADKHRMYPSDKLWRNINEQLHEQPNWPALTFGAILTMALITATLVFLHPTKDVFTTPNYAYNTTSVTSIKQADAVPSKKEPTKFLKSSGQKEPVYAFNSSIVAVEENNISDEHDFAQPIESLSSVVTTDYSLTSEVTTLHSSVSKLDAEKIVASNIILAKVSTQPLPDVATAPLTKKAETSEIKEKTKNDSEEPLSDYTAARTVHLPKVNNKRWHLEVYGGSNISYRTLRESMFDNHTSSGQSLSNDRGNLDAVVSQKPSVGINAGVAFVYAVSDRFRIKTGVQFNFRQYNIDAYKSSFERSVLLLNNGYYYPDSVYTYSALSTGQGKAISLSNKYYQIGIPIGVEWTAAKLPKVHFDLAANVQPTYQFNSNNYLLTSDYKSYVQAPGLLRRININAGLEATANFNAGNLQWQVGPQILYQTMPTQKNNYSIHEHLIDYGVRVGIIKKL